LISHLFLKIRAGALPCHIRRRSNFTSRAEANATTHKQTRTNNTHNKTPHHHHLGEEPRESSQPTLSSPTLCHDQSRNRCKLNMPPKLHHGLSPTSCTHSVVDLSTPTLLQQKSLVAAPMKTTDPSHSAWGPRLIIRLTTPPRTRIPETALEAPPLPSRC
jgi:hypothetical protein